jgi:type VI secretion system protein ImpI
MGRLHDCTWVLPSFYVSCHHAAIIFAADVFYIVDFSDSGIFINSADNRVVRSQPYPLQPGDRIYIEPYEISVSFGEALVDVELLSSQHRSR